MKMNVERRERIPNFSFDTAVGKGGQTEWVSDGFAVVEAPFYISFSNAACEKFKRRETLRMSDTDRQKKGEVSDLSSVKRNQQRHERQCCPSVWDCKSL